MIKIITELHALPFMFAFRQSFLSQGSEAFFYHVGLKIFFINWVTRFFYHMGLKITRFFERDATLPSFVFSPVCLRLCCLRWRALYLF